MEEGIGFDGSAIEGFTTPDEADMLAFPDPSTFQILPWRLRATARPASLDACTPDRQRFAGDSRECLRRMFYRAEKLGYIMNVGANWSFTTSRRAYPRAVGRRGLFRPFRRPTPLGTCAAPRCSCSRRSAIPIEYTFHSSGHSQHGISMRHAEALTMSDAIMTAKHVISTCAYEAGIHASFMPKPIAKGSSSAMFLHQSLFDREGNNVFWGDVFAKPPVVDRQELHGRHPRPMRPRSAPSPTPR